MDNFNCFSQKPVFSFWTYCWWCHFLYLHYNFLYLTVRIIYSVVFQVMRPLNDRCHMRVHWIVPFLFLHVVYVASLVGFMAAIRHIEFRFDELRDLWQGIIVSASSIGTLSSRFYTVLSNWFSFFLLFKLLRLICCCCQMMISCFLNLKSSGKHICPNQSSGCGMKILTVFNSWPYLYSYRFWQIFSGYQTHFLRYYLWL